MSDTLESRAQECWEDVFNAYADQVDSRKFEDRKQAEVIAAFARAEIARELRALAREMRTPQFGVTCDHERGYCDGLDAAAGDLSDRATEIEKGER